MLCLDSYVMMDALSDIKERSTKAQKYLEEASLAGGVISSTVLTEVFFQIAKRKNIEDAYKALHFIESIENLEILEVSRDIAVSAGNLRTKYYKNKSREISYLDCIHLATGILAGCKKFVTGDRDFRGVEEIEVEIY